MPLYRCFGLLIASEIEVAEWQPLDTDCQPDVRIRVGPVPNDLNDAIEENEMWAGKASTLLLRRTPAGRYLIETGDRITVEPATGAHSGDIAAFLVSSAMAALLHQRDLLLIHASVVSINGSGVFIFGASGAGKSTTAAALVSMGHRLVSDDQLVCSLTSGAPVAIAGHSRIRLWADAAERMGFTTETALRLRKSEQKFALDLTNADVPDLPVRTGVHLLQTPRDEVACTPVTPREAFELLWTYCFRRRYAIGMGHRARLFRQISTLAAQTRLVRVSRPIGTVSVDEVAETILREIESGAV